jgi:D-alanyl-D-alanine carboxypeptidase
MLYAMLLNSANNAATVIANNLGRLVLAKKEGKYFSCFDVNSENRRKNIEYFVKLMTQFTQKFQLNTTFI